MTFFRVTLPLLRPSLALCLIISVTGSLLAFDQFFILTNGGPDNSTTTVVMMIYREAFRKFDQRTAAALSIVVLLALPGTLMAQVPRAILGRRLDFKALASAELAGQTGFYAAAVPLAAAGLGVWSAVIGWWLQFVILWPMLYRAAHYRPRWE